MSDLGVPPESPHSAPAGPRSSDARLWALFAGLALVLALTIVAILALTGGDSSAAKAPTHPEHWDPRIAPYAAIAEQQRDLRFEHPVKVRFLPAAAFEKSVTTDDAELSKGDRKELDHFTGLMRAFGLIKGDVDLFDAFNDATGGGTLAYYSFDDKSITVRGDKVTPAVGSTLVHELTHVLQDQHFGIGDRMAKLEKQAEKGESTSESSVLDAIVEGDAERVEGLYRASLSTKQRSALDAGRADEATEAGKRLEQVPKVVTTMISSPYTLGEGLVQTVAADGGNGAVDDLFRDTPKHEAALLDPFQVLAGNTNETHVDEPKAPARDKKFDAGEFGVLTWYLMLAERLPVKDALAVADGWAGDAYVGYEHDGDSCARISYAGRTPADTERMHSALQRWIGAAPGSPAKVSREGGVVQFESCDPGTASKVGNDKSDEAIGLVTARTVLGVGMMRSGVSEDVADCLAGKLVQSFPVAKLNDPRAGLDPQVQRQIQQLALGCRASA